MIEKGKDILDNSIYIVYLQFIFVSLVFGLTSFFYKVRNKELDKNFFNLISEMFFSLVAGYIAFNICKHLSIDLNLLWVIVSISSWSGVRFLNFIEDLLEKYLTKKFGLDESEKKIENKEVDKVEEYIPKSKTVNDEEKEGD